MRMKSQMGRSLIGDYMIQGFPGIMHVYHVRKFAVEIFSGDTGRRITL